MDNFLTGLEEIKNKTNMVWMPPALSVPTRKTAKKLITEQSKGLSNMNSKWFIEKEKDPTYRLEIDTMSVFWKTHGRLEYYRFHQLDWWRRIHFIFYHSMYMASRCAGGGVFTVSTKSAWRSWYKNFSTICQQEALLGVWLPRELQGSAEGKKTLPSSSTDVGKRVLPAL